MKNTLSLIVVLLCTIFSFGQSNPVQFFYNQQPVSGTLKSSLQNLQNEITVKEENGNETVFKISGISEIEIDGEKYSAAKVLFDPILTRTTANLDYSPEPNYEPSWLLLKVLVAGTYNLYQFSSGNFIQYYYQDFVTDEIKPLIFKEYLLSSHSSKKNNRFRIQLRNDVPLPSYVWSNYQQIGYTQNDLRRYFNKLNHYEENEGIEKMNLKVSVFAGALTNDLQGRPYNSDISIAGFGFLNHHLEKKSTPVFGISTEILFDKKEANALFAEVGFTQYKTSYYLDYYSPELTKIDFDFKTNILLFNIGYKRYFNLLPNSKIYLSGSISANFFLTSENHTKYHWFSSWYDHYGNYQERHSDLVLKGRKNFSDFGGRVSLGYTFKSHYFIEANYRKGLKSENIGILYNTLSVVAGYTF